MFLFSSEVVLISQTPEATLNSPGQRNSLGHTSSTNSRKKRGGSVCGRTGKPKPQNLDAFFTIDIKKIDKFLELSEIKYTWINCHK